LVLNIDAKTAAKARRGDEKGPEEIDGVWLEKNIA
jgi:hypothetical protein